MKIEFNEQEIVAGLHLYIQQQGINLTDKDVSVTFTNGRKENGLSAEVTIDVHTLASSLIVPTEPQKVPALGKAVAYAASPEPVTEVPVEEAVTTAPDTVATEPEAPKQSLFSV